MSDPVSKQPSPQVTQIKIRARKFEDDRDYYRVAFFTGKSEQTLAHSGELLLKQEEWRILLCRLNGWAYPEGVSGRVSIEGALPPEEIARE